MAKFERRMQSQVVVGSRDSRPTSQICQIQMFEIWSFLIPPTLALTSGRCLRF